MKKISFKIQNLYILIAFLLITFEFLIAVSIYCYLIRYQAKEKHYDLTSQIVNQETFYFNKCIIKMESNDKLKEINIKNCI